MYLYYVNKNGVMVSVVDCGFEHARFKTKTIKLVFAASPQAHIIKE